VPIEKNLDRVLTFSVGQVRVSDLAFLARSNVCCSGMIVSIMKFRHSVRVVRRYDCETGRDSRIRIYSPNACSRIPT
jgi:hypothetical protein